MNQAKPKKSEPSNEATRRLRREPRWTVVSIVQPQGGEGERWLQMTYAREPLEWWAEIVAKAKRQPK